MEKKWSTESVWLSVGNGVSTSGIPFRCEWVEEGWLFWARMPKPLTLAEVARLVEYVFAAVQCPDGDLLIREDEEYFAVGLEID